MSRETYGTHDRPAVDVALLVVRVIVGIIFAAHGAQKLFGAFGGPGLAAMVQPPPDGLGLIVGFLTRFSAASLIVIMLGAIGLVHGQHGFFLGRAPTDTLATAGFE